MHTRHILFLVPHIHMFLQGILNQVQTGLLLNAPKFENAYLNMLIVPVLVGVFGTWCSHFSDRAEEAVFTLKNWWWNPTSKYAASIECEGTIIQLSYTTRVDLDLGMAAFFHHIFENFDKVRGLTHLRRIPERRGICDYDRTDYPIFEEFFLSQTTPITLDNGIQLFPSASTSNANDDVESGKKQKPNTKSYMVRVVYDVHKDSDRNMRRLIEIYQEVKATYLEYKDNQMDSDRQHVYMYGSKENDQVHFNRYSIQGEPRQMDHIWFPEKDRFLEEISHFIDNPDFYRKRGKPYRKVILAYGVPGCGKTSLLIALANLMKCKKGKYPRQLIHLKLDSLSRKDLMDILFQEEVHVNGAFDVTVRIPFDRRIYYIEEMDSYEMTHERKKPTRVQSPSVSNDTGSISSDDFSVLSDSSASEESKRLTFQKMLCNPAPKKVEDKLSIGDLLEALDGIPSMKSGEIIVMTTNHIDKIDAALKREGRVNYMIHFEEARRIDTVHQLEFYYEKAVTTAEQRRLPDKKWTPAYIESMCDASKTLGEAVTRLSI
jgi:DNA polymerase III delta prime subunit